MARPSAGSRLGNLEIRILSAAVLGPVVLAAVWMGGAVFTILTAATAVIIVREWARLVCGGRRVPAAEILSYVFVIASLALYLIAGPLAGIAATMGLGIVLHVLLWARRIASRVHIAFGIPYIGLAAIAVVWLRELPEIGMGIVFWLCLAVWSTDVGAYAAGRSIGGPKLAPAISPKKTWAGLIGGMASAALVGAVAAAAFDAAQPGLAAAVGAALALLAQGGDLFESAVKRHFGVKDSGHLIPGHGGMLDRMDGFLAAAPALALFHAGPGGAIGWW